METSAKELIAVLVTMAVLFIFALVVVGIFLNVWRKEKRAREQEGKRPQ
jgi:heme/copper-type cytochrome/quinol oxidase subunit 2